MTVAVLVDSAGAYGFATHPIRTETTTPTPTPWPLPAVLIPKLATTLNQCPIGFAWSPDSLRIAVVAGAYHGSSEVCSQVGAGDSVEYVGIFDARTVSRLQEIHVTDIAKAQHFTGAIGQPSWMPDGQSLIFPVVQQPATPTPGATPIVSASARAGLLIVPVDTGKPQRLLLDAAGNTAARPIWNIANSRIVTGQTAALPPAATYKWSADGQVLADTPAPSDQGSFAGSPVAAIATATFSRWQPGSISPAGRQISVQGPPAWFHISDVGVWSADRQFFAPRLAVYTRLPDSPGAARARLRPTDGPCAEFAATKNSKGVTTTKWYSVGVTWRPDGKVLAAILPSDDFPQHHSTVRVSLFDTATGTILATLSTTRQNTDPTKMDEQAHLQWAPNGLQLALEQICKGLNRRAASEEASDRADSLFASLTFLRFAVVDTGNSRVTIWGSSSLAALPEVDK